MIIDKNKISPMMKHYLLLKEKYPDVLILFRLGDFYEMFFDDAKLASSILNLTLTGRDCGLDEKAPMCGVPFHAVYNYIYKLIEHNIKVGICEQLTKPGDQKGIVERDIVRIITPGTVIESNILKDNDNNYILSIYKNCDNIGLAWMDNSTGEFYCVEFKKDYKLLDNYLSIIRPSEIICNNEFKSGELKSQLIKSQIIVNPYEYLDVNFEYNYAYSILLNQFKVKDLSCFEIQNLNFAISAAGALVKYVKEHHMKDLLNLKDIKTINQNKQMVLDNATIKNLELFETLKDNNVNGSLFKTLNYTNTAFGARMLKKWIAMPLLNKSEILKRLNAVSLFYDNRMALEEFSQLVSNIKDIERYVTRLSFGATGPRDLLTIAISIKNFKVLKEMLVSFSDDIYLNEIYQNITVFDDISNEIIKAISDNSPLLARDGGFINRGYDCELDSLRNIKTEVFTWLNNYEAQVKAKTGVKTLKISYNKIFGYYIEVPRSQSNLMGEEFLRKQTTVNNERFTTEELTKKEIDILTSDEKVIAREVEIFNKLALLVSEKITLILKSIEYISYLDCILSLAKVSLENNYCKPEIKDENSDLIIINGRHPVIEKIIGFNNYIKNDTFLNSTTDLEMIITGPNMSGKSTYMRQVALIVLMAQIGCFVPAEKAEIPVFDRIFTRIGASDDLSKGLSTFMVEMMEIATILLNATNKSLLIIDEIGRGTSTRDGLSIAWSTVEYIINNLRAKTLFSTHYHELTELEGLMEGVKNYCISVKEIGDDIIFLHKIEKGGASKSFGIEVAELAGVPKAITKRAQSIAKIIDQNNKNRDNNQIVLSNVNSINKKNSKQLTIFETIDNENNEILKKLQQLDLDSISPRQALQILDELKELSNGKN